MADSDQQVLSDKTNSENTAPAPSNVTVMKPAAVDKFAGEGVLFKAKLFGTADVNEPRGDNVCNTAIGLLKAAVKNTGEHKQKIIVKINYSGITLLDAVNQLKLFEHAINKISFISKDPTDNRAFGYIVTEKEGKHTYFGIRTEKTADQAVFALRDLFQAAFELKKKENEMKGQTTQKPATQEAPAASPPADQSAQPTQGSAAPAETQPAMIGEPPKPAMKKEDSASHLLDLISDLSVEPAQAATTASQSFSQQPWPPATTQSQPSNQWGNAVPAQNDPFMVQQSANQQPAQQNDLMVDQQEKQKQQIQALYNQQPAFQQSFAQPNPQQAAFGASPFGQPQQPFGQQQSFGAPQQPFGQPQQPFQPAPQQQTMYQPQAFPQQQQNPSPFAQPQQQFSSPFPSNDPFNTAGYQQPNQMFQSQPQQQQSQPQQAPATNPFASPLQPQAVPQPAPRTSIGGQPPQTNLFSDLNPLPNSSVGAVKGDPFSELRNPPKPKINDMIGGPQNGAVTNNTQQLPNQTNTPSTYDWLNQLVGPNQKHPDGAPATQVQPNRSSAVGLIAPPPPVSRRQVQFS